MQGTFEGGTIKLMPQLTLLKKIEASFGLTVQFIFFLNIVASPAKTASSKCATHINAYSHSTISVIERLFGKARWFLLVVRLG